MLRFIRDYRGVCNDDIETLWRTACRFVSQQAAEPPREFPLRRKAGGKVSVSVVLPIAQNQGGGYGIFFVCALHREYSLCQLLFG